MRVDATAGRMICAWGDAEEDPVYAPATWPPMGEDAELPWLPTDPIPNTEPEAPGLDMPDPETYHASTALLPFDRM